MHAAQKHMSSRQPPTAMRLSYSLDCCAVGRPFLSMASNSFSSDSSSCNHSTRYSVVFSHTYIAVCCVHGCRLCCINTVFTLVTNIHFSASHTYIVWLLLLCAVYKYSYLLTYTMHRQSNTAHSVTDTDYNRAWAHNYGFGRYVAVIPEPSCRRSVVKWRFGRQFCSFLPWTAKPAVTARP